MLKKSDKRISQITEISKNYFQIFSAKVDHSVDIANQLLKDKLMKVQIGGRMGLNHDRVALYTLSKRAPSTTRPPSPY